MRRSTRNVLGYAVPEVFWGFAWAITLDYPMIAAFGESVGAAKGFVGNVSLAVGLSLALPMIVAGWATRTLVHKRTLIFWGHIAGSLVLLLLALALHLTQEASPLVRQWVYGTGVAAFFMTIGFLVPPWLSLVGDLFVAGTRTRVLGVTFIFNRLGGFAGGAWARSALQDSASPWVGLFLLAGVMTFLGSLPYLWLVEKARTPEPRPPLRAYLEGLVTAVRTNRRLRRFIGADLLGVSYFVLLAYFAKAGFDVAQLDTSMAGTWTQLGALGILLASMMLAWRGHVLLPKTWMAGSLFVAAVAAGLTAWGGAPWVYGVAAVACGWCLGTRMACHAPEVLRVSAGDTTAAVGTAGALATTAQGLMPFLAGCALVVTSYALVFWVTAGLTALGGLLMLGAGAGGDGASRPNSVEGS